jgi:sigma-E factor negative regulatory protein RseC
MCAMQKIDTSDTSVSHLGIISDISKEIIEIAISESVHCASCHAKSACGLAETTTKIIRVPNKGKSFTLNESVRIVMSNNTGLKAVFFGYVLPFILLFVVLFVSSVFVKEWQAGLLALFVLIPYYLFLYFNEKVIKKVVKINILKIP